MIDSTKPMGECDSLRTVLCSLSTQNNESAMQFALCSVSWVASQKIHENIIFPQLTLLAIMTGQKFAGHCGITG